MKFFLMIFAFVFSQFAFAQQIHHCKYKEYNIDLSFVDSKNITVEVFKNKTKVSSCDLVIEYIDDGKNSVSQSTLRRFERKSCLKLFDKAAGDLEIIKQGFIRQEISGHKSFVYLIKNEQPLRCNY